ncbi:bestrophin-4 isoform X2 [Drosophila mauritiana]|uniref:Bestrophin homolog n=2 Tax=Drosophila mauritiana TaxID=7226 RepID=A0A6P8JXM4_DROMA|nr:bestrophin-4 isoform X2 [Drosophila mauritiana]
MTVTYTSRVSTSSVFSNFLGLLVRWRGSIYKLIWLDLIVFFGLYCLLAITYRLLVNEEGKRFFEAIMSYCEKNGSLIPLSFVLGFFVRIVMNRWWDQYTTIPWPDGIAILISTSIHGSDDRARVMRRTILRYVCLCQVIVFTMISPRVKRRFPTYTQIIEAGFLLENEKKIIEAMDQAFPSYPKHWMPIVWAASIVMRARRENKIRDDYAVKTIIDELNQLRGNCGFLLYYDWISVPLVYTQVVTVATYSFFLFSVLGQQWNESHSDEDGTRIRRWFPILTVLQFFFYMGWLKVAETLINPFGEDDDDFELNWIIDRNLTVSYCIVDEMHQEHPELVKDQYWEEVFPNEIPYAQPKMRQNPPAASTAYMESQSKLQKRRESAMSTLSTRSRNNFRQNFLGRPSATGSYSDSIQMEDGPSRVTFSENQFDLPQDDANSSHKPSQSTIDFNDLIEQRRRERRERIRHRFLDMQSTHLRHDTSGAPYTITVLRPPSDETLSESQEAGDRAQQDPSGSKEPPPNKTEKQD